MSNRKLKYLFLILMAFAAVSVPAQNSEHQKVKALSFRAMDLRRSQPDSALHCAKQALRLAEEADYLVGKVVASQAVGLCYSALSRNEEALQYLTRSVALAESTGDRHLMAESYFHSAEVYGLMSNYGMSIASYYEAMRHFEAIKLSTGLLRCYNGIANVCYSQQNYQKALEYFQKANAATDSISERDRFAVLMNIGLAQNDLKRHDSALHYYHLASRHVDSGNEYLLADFHTNMGICLADLKDYPKALEHMEKAKKTYEKAGDKFHLEILFSNLGDIYLNMSEHSMAEKYLVEGYRLASEINDIEGIKISCFALARLYGSMRKFEKAFAYSQRYIVLKDSLQAGSQNLIEDIQTKYETDKRDHEIEILNKDRQLQEIVIEKQKTQRTAFIAGLAALLAFSIFIFSSYRRKRRDHRTISLQKEEVEAQKKIIEDKNKEILDSIHYARRIQKALLATEKYVARAMTRLRG